MTARPAHRARRLAATFTALLTAGVLASLAACSSDAGATAEPSATANDDAPAALGRVPLCGRLRRSEGCVLPPVAQPGQG